MITVVRNETGLTRILWENETKSIAGVLSTAQHSPTDSVLQDARQQMQDYFAGNLRFFSLPLCPEGTEFQKMTWQSLRTIPYGKTISYGQQATQLGDSKKARAVGAANGKNPLSIVVPCHRVVGANGALTGFAGGIEAKKFLLNLEKKYFLAGK